MTAPDRTSKLSKFQLAQMGVSIHEPEGVRTDNCGSDMAFFLKSNETLANYSLGGNVITDDG